MNEKIFLEVEETFSQLSVPEQLRLIARLVLRIRERTGGGRAELDTRLKQMAADPPADAETKKIESDSSRATFEEGPESKRPS